MFDVDAHQERQLNKHLAKYDAEELENDREETDEEKFNNVLAYIEHNFPEYTPREIFDMDEITIEEYNLLERYL